MHLARLSPAMLLALLCPALLAGTAAESLPLGKGFRASFEPTGTWRLESDKGALLVHCGLRFWVRTRFLQQSEARPASPPGEGPEGRTFHGILRTGQQTIAYWQTATPVPEGLLVQYGVSAPGLGDSDEVAAAFELPVDTFRGAACSVAGAQPLTLPDAKTEDPYVFQGPAEALTVRRNGLTISIQRSPRGKVIVQDDRHFNNPYFQALLYAARGPGDPEGWHSVSFLVRLGEPAAGPLIATVAPGRAEVPRGDFYEAGISLWGPHENPYDDAQVRLWAQVTAPSGQAYEVPGFLSRDFDYSRKGEVERLEPVGHTHWRVRIAPTEPGTHSFIVHLKTPAGEAASEPFAFAAAEAPGQPFLRAPTTQPRYLETAAGDPVFLIGYNYCWPSDTTPTAELDGALDRMARSGLNATRLWLSTWGIRIEGSRPDDYRLDGAWRLDRLLRRARERGIYVQLCLDNFYDLTAEDRAGENPYLARNGGPCRTSDQFFASPKAVAQHHRRLRYLIARYAPFSSLLAWELCNELDYAASDRRDPALLAWARGEATFLRQRDPWHHPVTVSLGPRSTWEELWRLPELDMVQAHAYIHRPVWVQNPEELDAAALLLQTKGPQNAFGKPLLVSEFGYLGTKDFNPLNEADKTGIHLHNAIWASALSGSAGAAMGWWWDSYLAKNDLDYHYAALARFLRDEALPAADWAPVRDTGKGPVRVVGLRGRDAALLWIQHRDNTWYRRVVERRDAVTLKGVTVNLTGLFEGRYKVEWWDTYAGQPTTHTDQSADGGQLILRVPPGFPDIACKVRRMSK